MNGNSLLVLLLVGAVVGWLAGQIMRGSGYGLLGDIVIGLLGAFVGNVLADTLNIHVHLGRPWLDTGVVALAGALVLLAVISALRPRTMSERMQSWFRR